MLSGVIQFAEYTLDCDRYELLRDAQRIKLEKLPMELLILLVEKDGHLVSRQEIVARLWGSDVFVDTEHGINTAVRKLRTVLGDKPEQPRFVETIPGKGYRFVAIPTKNPTNGNGSVRDATIPPPATLRTQIARRWSIAAGAIAMVAALGLGVQGWVFKPAPSPQVRSIAVLPLANLSGDPSQDYFADGLTDELTTMMAKNTALQVVSRTSAMQYKNAHQPLREIAKALRADAILEGSLQRSGNRLHMTVQLIYAPTDTHLWANSYDRDGDEAANLPAEIAQAVGTQVKAAKAVAAPRRVNPEAHDAYLRGRYFWYAVDFKRSHEFMEKAVQLQPDYAVAWSGLADAVAVEAIAGTVPPSEVKAKAEAASRKALELDPTLAQAHDTAGAINLFFEWNWKVADEESRLAASMDPDSALHHHLRAYVLTATQHLNEALEEAKKASQLAPFQHPFGLGVALLNAGRYDAAIEELRLRKEAQPSDLTVRFNLAKCYHLKGMEKESVMEIAEAYEQAGNKRTAAAIREAFRNGGAKAVAQWRLNDLKTQARKRYISPRTFALAYASLGMKEETLKSLEAAYEERAPFLVFLQSDPDFDFLHSDKRYRAIIDKMGLPPAY